MLIKHKKPLNETIDSGKIVVVNYKNQHIPIPITEVMIEVTDNNITKLVSLGEFLVEQNSKIENLQHSLNDFKFDNSKKIEKLVNAIEFLNNKVNEKGVI